MNLVYMSTGALTFFWSRKQSDYLECSPKWYRCVPIYTYLCECVIFAIYWALKWETSSELNAFYILSNIWELWLWLNQFVQPYVSDLTCPYPVPLRVGNCQAFIDPHASKNICTLALVHLKPRKTPKGHESHRWIPMGKAFHLGHPTLEP